MKCTYQNHNFIIQGQQNNGVDETSVVLIDSTCLPNSILNSNNAIDSSNLLYVTGSFIVQQNIFQNMKTFIQRVSDAQIMGMTHNQMGESQFALVSKQKVSDIKSNNIQIEYYLPSTKDAKLYTIQDIDKIIDFKFLDSKKLIIVFASKMQYYIGIINLNEKLSKINITTIHNQPRKLIINERKAFIICRKGLLQYDELCEDITRQLILPDTEIVDFKIVDNQIQLILSEQFLEVRQSYELLQRECLNQYLQDQQKASCLVKIGRNILISYRTSIIISHFILEEQKLRFVNNYTYKEKIKGGVSRIVQSFDEMHLVMTVFTKERDQEKLENFMFNLSILSSNKKFINPFMRTSPLGIEPGDPAWFQNAVISVSYYLSGPYIIGYDYLQTIQKRHKFMLHDNPKCFAVHPMGYQFCCIYETFIKFYSKIQNQLMDIWTEQMICCAASFSLTGLLALAFLEDNRYQIMIYDCYNFRKIKNISSFYSKQLITRIEWCYNSACLAVYCQNQFYIYKLTGQKKVQFKEKSICSYMQYQQNKEQLIVCTQLQQLQVFKKKNPNDSTLQLIRTVQINETATCVKVNSNLGLLFISTQSGRLLWTDYPLQNTLDSESIRWQKLNLHSNPVTQLLISNNLKYIFASVKNRGLFIGRIKKNYKNQNNYMMFQDLQVSNLNFLQMSSKQCLQNGKQKLKILLQKRKTSFNELEELKKQWDIRKNFRINILQTQNQKQQLKEITTTLNKLDELKVFQKKMKQQLIDLQQEQQKYFQQRQDKYEREILFQYEKNDELNKTKQETITKCQRDYQSIIHKCQRNLTSIENELQAKYNNFLENYEIMKENLIKQQKRLKFEQEEEKQEEKILVQLKIKELQGDDYELQKDNNELKSQLARTKKEIDRFSHRKEFLETKIRFFGEELTYCEEQKYCLEDIKQKLQEQLMELQNMTHKKQKRLRKYFKENDLLTKFKHVHEHLKITTNKQVSFLEQQIQKVMKNIIETQKELSQVAQLNQKSQAIVRNRNQNIVELKQMYKNKSYRFRYLKLMHSQIILALQNLPSRLTEDKKAKELSKIYQKFYVDKKLEVFIIATSQKEEEVMETKNFMNEFEKRNQQKIHKNLQLHKQYLEDNLTLLDKHSEKKKQEMNLCYLKYQAQNYNLIAECNIRKEQTAKKKRLLHQLIDSIKERQLVLNEFYKEDKPVQSKPRAQTPGQIPYISYKKKLEQSQIIHKPSTLKHPSATSIKVGNSVYKVRKLLEVQKSRINDQSKPERRIKTALIKKRETLPQEDDDDIGIETEEMISKPMTANLNKRNRNKLHRNYIRQKSNSKPTTATLSSKIKLSMIH